jgi:Ca2+-binding RTX toxin-like protein
MIKRVARGGAGAALVCVVIAAVPGALAQTGPFRDDVVASFDPASLVAVTVDDETSAVNLTSGLVVLEVEDTGCVPSATDPCHAVLKYLRITHESFTVNTNVGFFTVSGPSVIIRGPIPIQDSGAGFVVPAGTPVDVGADLSGEFEDGTTIPTGARSRAGTLKQPAFIGLVVPSQIVSVDGSFDFSFVIQGETLGGAINVMLSGAEPFINVPPVAVAGADQTFTCGDEVTLDGSASTDADGNIDSFRWFLGGNLLAQGQTADVDLPSGVHNITLEVRDSFGGRGLDTVAITVQNPLPTFTFVPPDVSAATCGPVDIGQALATSSCPPVTVTNDAPSSFPAGITIVTWTATDRVGTPAQATQQVTIPLSDDPQCCPAGSNTIVGTPQNDVLTGTAGADCILGLNGHDTIAGLGGNDVISGGNGIDVISGGDGNDFMTGGNGNDQLSGEGGDDRLDAGNGDDVLDGGGGSDQCIGGGGSDQTLSCE